MRLVSLQCPPELSATVLSDALMEAGALYVSVSDGNVGTAEERPIFAAHAADGAISYESDEPNPESWDELMSARRLWSNSSLEVGFAPSADVSRAMLSVLADAGLSVNYAVDDLAPRDWVTEVQSNWPPVVLPAARLTIRFPWHTAEDLPAAASSTDVVTLHPGMAFGTGEHQTTQLCCVALRRLIAATASASAATASASAATASGAPTTVLDYGSGSGILSFASLLFGADGAIGVEIDVEALATSRLNAAENAMAERFVAELPEDEAARGQTYPLVVANILAGTLVELSDTLTARVASGGTLLMSGIWGDEQAERVTHVFEAHGFAFAPPVYAEGGWALLEATKQAAAAAPVAVADGDAPPAATTVDGPPPPAGFEWGSVH